MANEAFIFTRDRFPDTEVLKAELRFIFDALHLNYDFGSNDTVSVSSPDYGCGCVMYVGDDAEGCTADAELYHLPGGLISQKTEGARFIRIPFPLFVYAVINQPVQT